MFNASPIGSVYLCLGFASVGLSGALVSKAGWAHWGELLMANVMLVHAHVSTCRVYLAASG